VRRGDVTAVHSLRRGAAEAFEIIAHGDAGTSKVVGRRIEEIRLPKGATIGAILRGSDNEHGRRQVIMPHHDTVIEPDDHVIMFCTAKKLVRQVEKLFQVGLGYL